MMAYDYFEVTQKDEAFFEKNIRSRLTCEIMDVHSHINKPEHVVNVSKQRIESDWALQSGYQMTVEDARYYVSKLFPGIHYQYTGFPFPIKEADLTGNNDYIAELVDLGEISYGLMALLPDWDRDYMEKNLPRFAGVKPYPDLVAGSKGADISIFDCITHDQLALIEEMGKCVMMHLPRAGRLADENNVKELKEIRRRYPKLKMIIAHIGRCFNLSYFEKAIQKLGDDIHGFWFDTAAVLNPAVQHKAMETIHPHRLMFGLDLPIFLWHGKRRWTNDKYFNLCREDFSWNRHEEGRTVEAGYTFFVYEQVKNLLDQMDALNLGEEYKRNFFKDNATKLLNGCTKSAK